MAGTLGDPSFEKFMDENLIITPVDASSRDSIHGDSHWRIETIEPPGSKFSKIKIKGQFPLENGIKIRMDGNVPETGSYGQNQPFIQWVKGELEVITFDVVLYARDREEDIDYIFEQFKTLLRKDEFLRRPPICKFTFGKLDPVKCIVRGYGEVAYDRPTDQGQTRSIKFPVTLARFTPYSLKEVDRNAPIKESRYQIVSGEDRMYEMLAKKEFGVEYSLYGVILRQKNRSMPFAADEETLVKIPDADVILNQDIYPEFHAFDLSKDNIAESYIDKFTARNNRVGYR